MKQVRCTIKRLAIDYVYNDQLRLLQKITQSLAIKLLRVCLCLNHGSWITY